MKGRGFEGIEKRIFLFAGHSPIRYRPNQIREMNANW